MWARRTAVAGLGPLIGLSASAGCLSMGPGGVNWPQTMVKTGVWLASQAMAQEQRRKGEERRQAQLDAFRAEQRRQFAELRDELARASEPNGTPGHEQYRHAVYTLPQPSVTIPRAPRRVPVRPSPSATDECSVELSSTIGIAPLLIDYTVRMPARDERGADFLWTDNGIPIGNHSGGQKVLTRAGEHHISVLVIAQDGKEYRASGNVTVLSPLERM